MMQSVVKSFRLSSRSQRLLNTSAACSEKVTSRDTRLAGRLRFYKEVDVTDVSAPWQESEVKLDDTIASPISAGVDGSDSASGVKYLQDLGSSQLEYMLSPRRPGSVDTTDSPIGWFGVTLDGKTLKTPMGQTLSVPSQSLAIAIAAEWDAQEKYLKPAGMPLMTLACTTLDQVAHNPQVYRQECLNFLPTDTTCFWADPTTDRGLHRRQTEAWKDLHDFVEKKFRHAPAYAMGTNEGMIMVRKRENRNKPSGLPHNQELFDSATEWTFALDAWHLAALSSMCSQGKSFLLGWAVLESGSPFKEVRQAIEASRVEEEFQISSWGLVEGGHDYDRLNCSIQMNSAEVFSKAILLDNEL
ncbi:unnamed protein product [Cylindrotheca closterium]|uniref:ATP synthase mitochondrial F1 complex assembly factor 2 n=1 Tax=Cylindrotheca closterium TaxID=2856 RepID=A0AAD2CGB7_9STRA|nr:unnamed protein product [Cylindrotheca closterium]